MTTYTFSVEFSKFVQGYEIRILVKDGRGEVSTCEVVHPEQLMDESIRDRVFDSAKERIFDAIEASERNRNDG